MGARTGMTVGGRPRRPDLRAFCAGAFPWPLIAQLREGEEVVACYLLHEKRRGETRQEKPYLDLRLGDRTGTIAGKVWDDVERLEPLCRADEVVGVRGKVGRFQEKLQITVTALEPLSTTDEDLTFFLPTCPRDLAELERELDALIGTVEDPPLHALLRRCLGKKSSLGKAFRVHPAAKHNHHAYLGGLLEHSLSVARACDRLAAHYLQQGARLDRDLLVAGALLHDIGKVKELSAARSFSYTHEGQLLGHIVLGIQIVGREAEAVPGLPPERLLLLQHLIASHQGRLEWASPKIPQLLEALILHYADDLDSKMNPAITLLAGVGDGEWSSYDRHLERSLFNPAPFPRSAEVEPVAPEEAMELFIDLFRS